MQPLNHYIVVDDDDVNNLVCKYIIRMFDKDAHTTLFTDPEKALAFIGDSFREPVENSSAVILLDINMPVMNGWEFLEAFEMFDTKIQDQLTIYILSSSIDLGDMERAEQNPYVQGFYSKPLSLATLTLISEKNSQLL